MDAGFQKFTILKKDNPKLKLLIKLKLFEDIEDLSIKLCHNSDTLVSSVLKFLNEFGFDGLHFSYLRRNQEENFLVLETNKSLQQTSAFKPSGYLLGFSVDSSKEAIDLFNIDGFITIFYSDWEFGKELIPSLAFFLDYLIVDAYDFQASFFQPTIADHPSAL